MKRKTQEEKGITLVALIIAIIILVILAAVSIGVVYRTKIVDYAINGTYNYATESLRENEIMNGIESLLNSTINRIEDIVGDTDSDLDISTPPEEIDELKKPQVEVREITNYSFQINIINEYKEDTQFEYYVNGIKQGERTTEKTCNVENLALDTEYQIKVIVYNGEEQEETETSVKTECKNVLMLFDNGEIYNELTGGWIGRYGTNGTNPSVGTTIINELLTIHTWGTWCGYALYTQNKIDVSPYTKIVYEIAKDEKVYDSGYTSVAFGYSTRTEWKTL